MLDSKIEIYTVSNGYVVRSRRSEDYMGEDSIQNSHVFNDVKDLCAFLRKEILLPGQEKSDV